MNGRLQALLLLLAAGTSLHAQDRSRKALDVSSLPGTKPLTIEGDIASLLVEGVDRFLLKQIEKSVEERATRWKRDFTSPADYTKSVEPNRKRLAHILGVRDARVPFDDLTVNATTRSDGTVASSKNVLIQAIRWPAFGDVYGDGLLLTPMRGTVRGDVIAIPDADQSPEQLCGLVEGVPAESQFPRRLAESGCRVLVPALIDRTIEPRGGRAKLTNREYLYRPAFELGRHIIGYETQKVLALVDWLSAQEERGGRKIGVIGYGEGGLIALAAAALDPRIHAAGVSGYFGDRQKVWTEPIDRNVFGLLHEFGDAELASLVAPRALIVEACRGPEVTVPPDLGGAPGKLTTPPLEEVRAEVERAKRLTQQLRPAAGIKLVVSGDGNGLFASGPAVQAFLEALSPGAFYARTASPFEYARKPPDFAAQMRSRIQEIERHNRHLLGEAEYVRKDFFKDLDTKSLDGFKKTIERYRQYYRDEVIGHFDLTPLPFNTRTRKAYDNPKWVGHEVVLDVFPDVIAYGVLLLPKDIRAGEKRPVVVCQHGLEGRPKDVIEGDHRAYHDYAAKLAERGFITFAPQNLYIFKDRFRTLQRKANPIKKTLFSVIVPQHQQIVNWLKTLPYVDPERIAFYGLSYGGKSAMRIPPLVNDYCLSICSADFNEWVKKNASTHARYSYVWTGEYEIFEFDLGSTFNYAEMAALICPRPFMVERGHFDGVGVDEEVAFEFAKVRNLYQAQLKLKYRCEIEWFDGPHTINGQGTFDFLHKHLAWPKPPDGNPQKRK